MAKEIKNRRENILINEIPPEILDETKLSADGFVKNTDYASASAGGVLRISTSYGVAVASTGNLTAATRTADQYATAPGTLIIGKGTLENIIASLITNMFVSEADPEGDATDGTKWNFTLYKQTAQGGGSEYIWLVEETPAP